MGLPHGVVARVFGYSSNLVVSGIINNVFNKIYPIIIGKFYGMTQTGYYTQADKYQDIASSLISNIFRSVAFPVFSTVQDDLPRLNRICRKNVKAIAFFIFPIMLLMIVVSYPFILLVLKAQWLPSVPYFRLLCLSGICSPFIILFYDLFNSLGYSRLNLFIEIGKKSYLFLVSPCSIVGYYEPYRVVGLVFVAVAGHGHIFCPQVHRLWLWRIPQGYISLFPAGIRFGHRSAGVYLLLPGDVWRLCIVPLVYAVAYLGGAYLLKLEMWQESMSMLKARLQKGGEA